MDRGRKGEGALLLVRLLVDRRCQPGWVVVGSGGGEALNKKGRCHVAAESPIDVMSCAGTGSGTGGKKRGVGGGGGGEVSLCDADDDAISPALWRPMGFAPGDV